MPMKRKKGKGSGGGKHAGKQGKYAASTSNNSSSGGRGTSTSPTVPAASSSSMQGRSTNTFSGRGSSLPLKGNNNNNDSVIDTNNITTTTSSTTSSKGSQQSNNNNNNVSSDFNTNTNTNTNVKNINNKRTLSRNNNNNNNSSKSNQREKSSTSTTTTNSNTVVLSSHNNNNNDINTVSSSNNNNVDTTAAATSTATTHNTSHTNNNDLILTCTIRRRGEYECDYCHNDISQLPRIRCAICYDFDLCFDCFINTDHNLTLHRMKAASATQIALLNEGVIVHTSLPLTHISHHNSDTNNNIHPLSHGYKVCDSTRYPLFPTNKQVIDYLTALQQVQAQQQQVQLQQQLQMSTTAEIDSETPPLPPPPHEVEDVTKQGSTMTESSDSTIATGSATTTKAISTAAAATIAQQQPISQQQQKLQSQQSFILQCDNEVKNYWTVEEDLRLLDGIKTHGLGNWVDIADSVAGYGSYGKTPRRCMERYFDDYLGRYGCILPSYTLIPTNYINDINNNNTNTYTNVPDTATNTTTTPSTPNDNMQTDAATMTNASTTTVSENQLMTDNTATTRNEINISSPQPSLLLLSENNTSSTRTSKRRAAMMSRISSPGSSTSLLTSGNYYTSFKQFDNSSSMSVGDFLSSASNYRKKYKAISTDTLLKSESFTSTPYWTPIPSYSDYVSSSTSKSSSTSTTVDDGTTNDSDNKSPPPPTTTEAATVVTNNETTTFSWEKLWPISYIPTIIGKEHQPIHMGQEVGRDQAYKAEQIYVKTIASCDSKEHVEKIRQEWMKHKLNKVGGPTVLPMRTEDINTLPGCDLAGFMPRRGDFDVEYDNEAEHAVADMEFIAGESNHDKLLKLKVLEIYNRKMNERDNRKTFVIQRKLYDYRKHQLLYNDSTNVTKDEHDLILRMRLIERYHTPIEHKQFLYDIIKMKRLRKEIMKLQLYKSLGIRTLVDAERYELDKQRRQYHTTMISSSSSKMITGTSSTNATHDSQQQRSISSSKMFSYGSNMDNRTSNNNEILDDNNNNEISSSSDYWKQYRDRKKERKSINRGVSTSSIADNNINKTETITVTETIENIASIVESTKNNDNNVDDKLNESDNTNVKNLVLEKLDNTSLLSGVDKPIESGTTNDNAMDIDEDDPAQTTSTEKLEGNTIPMQPEKSEQEHEQSISASTAQADVTTTITTTTTTTAEAHSNSIENLPGYHLLSNKEVQLCNSISITPEQYLEIKKALICECIANGFMNNKFDTIIPSPNRRTSSSSINNNNNMVTINTGTSNTISSSNNNNNRSSTTLLKLDIERRGPIIDFVVSAGWISSQFGNVAKSLS